MHFDGTPSNAPRIASGYTLCLIWVTQLLVRAPAPSTPCLQLDSSCRLQVASQRVVQIDRVQNPQLWRRYLTCHGELQARAGPGMETGSWLFHGAHPGAFPSNQPFSRFLQLLASSHVNASSAAPTATSTPRRRICARIICQPFQDAHTSVAENARSA